MTKTLYIHIGRPKVGSTAMQRFLKFNRELLLDNGVLYPKTGERENASHLLAQALEPGGDNLEVRKQLFADLVREISQSPASTAIVSSENFYFVEPRELQRQFPDDIKLKVICYVRRQDEVLVSSYIQEMKDGSLDPEDERDLDRYLGGTERLRLLDYKLVLDRWAAVFGVENIIVRVYEKGQLKGDLFSDILDVLDLKINDDYEMPEQRVNPTPAMDVLELIKVVNDYNLPPLIRRQVKSRLVEISEILDYAPEFDAKRIFTSARRANALARFEESNAATARKYLNRHDGALFRQGIEPDDGQLPALSQEKYSLDRLAEIWIGMLITQQKRISALERKLFRMHSELAKSGEEEG